MRDRERSPDKSSPLSEDIEKIRGAGRSIDEDMDVTKDFALFKRLKLEYPKLYEELINRLKVSFESRKSENS